LTRVARELEVSRTTLYRKLRAYNLEKFVPPAADSCVTISDHAAPWGVP